VKTPGKILLLLCLFAPLLALSQIDITKAKAYRNPADFNNDKPLYETTFKFIRKKEARFHGAYRVKAPELKNTGKDLNYGIWIIADDEYLYLNGTREGLLDGYYKFKKGSKYYYFQAEPRLSNAQQESLNNSALLFGLFGAALTNAQMNVKNSQKIHHVLDLENATTYYLTKEIIQELLVEYPVLLREFNEIENNDDMEVLKEYLEIIGSLD
jgi:hypothetical protein